MEKNQALKPVVLSLKGIQLAEATMYPMACQEYDAIKNAGRGYMYISLRGRGLGLMDWHGRLILDLMWDQISPYFDDNVIIAKKDKTFVLFDFEGRTLTGLPLDRLLDGKPGAKILSKTGDLMHVSVIDDFCDGVSRVKTAAGGGYVDAGGHYMMDAPHKFCGRFHDHRAVFEKNNGFFKPKTYGYINRKGGEIIKPVYAQASEFSEGFAVVKKDGKLGYIDKMGKPLECCIMAEGQKIPMPTMDKAEAFKNGYARVMKMGHSTVLPGGDGTVIIREDGEGGWGLINKEGLMTIPPRYNWLSDANEQGICLFGVSGSENAGLISVDGTVLLRPVFSDIVQMREGLFALKADGGWWMADKNGRIIGKKAWDQIGRLPSGGVCVRSGEKWGLIDHSGEMMMPLCSEMDFCLHHGSALIKRNGEYLLCDRALQELNPIRFEEAGNLLEGLSLVKWQGESYLLDYGFEPEKERL